MLLNNIFAVSLALSFVCMCVCVVCLLISYGLSEDGLVDIVRALKFWLTENNDLFSDKYF